MSGKGSSHSNHPYPASSPFMLPTWCPASSCSTPAPMKPHQTQIKTSTFSHLSADSLIPPKPLSSTPSATFPIAPGTDKSAQPIIHLGDHANSSDSSCNIPSFGHYFLNSRQLYLPYHHFLTQLFSNPHPKPK